MNTTRAARALRLLAATSVVGVASLTAASVAGAAAPGSAYVLSDVQCATDGGVVDITLVNDDAQDAAVFNVAGKGNVTVAPRSASALTYTGVANGSFRLAVTVDGADASVAVEVNCTMVDVRPSPRVGNVASLPSTGSGTGWGLGIGGGLVAAGIAASLLARRRYG